jgi:hypothetical protein
MANDVQIQAFLERYARALNEADLDVIADCWAIPGLAVTDAGAQSVVSSDGIKSRYSQALAKYHAQGLVMTKPQLEQAQTLSDRITAIDVRWVDFDASGAERAGERNRYLLRVGEDGQLRMHVSITRAV